MRVAAGGWPRAIACGLVLLLLAGCARDEGEGGPEGSPAGAAASGPAAEVPPAADVRSGQRLSGVERKRMREAQAEFAQGFDLLWGRKGVKDPKQAHAHLLKAAELGHAQSQGIVGVDYQMGRGTTRDLGEAIKWLTLSAENGWPHAQLKLGEAYRDGRGVDEDPVEALKWMTLASQGGSLAAGMMTGGYAMSLPPAQRREGAMRARAWRIAHGLPVKELAEPETVVEVVPTPDGETSPSGAPTPGAETATPGAPTPGAETATPGAPTPGAETAQPTVPPGSRPAPPGAGA